MEIKNSNQTITFTNPEEIIKNLDVASGSQAADFGCGSGYFSLPFAKAVGEDGKVYALDVLPAALEAVESQARVRGIFNIETRRVNLEKENGSGLDEGSIDWVIVKGILFQSSAKGNIIKEAYRVLKPQGKILVMEWNVGNFLVGPPKEKRVSQKEILDFLDKNNFIIKKTFPAGNFHYIIVAEK